MRSKQSILMAALLAALLGPGVPAALAADAPATASAVDKEGWYKHIVDIEFVKQWVDIPPKPGVMLIDARPAARKFDPGHIPGAINIPDTQFDKYVDKLPADKNTLLLIYCEGEKCMLSHKEAFKAEALGYTNVKVYAGGFPDWVAKGMTPAVSGAWIKKQLDDKTNLVLVDSRPARVFAQGAIPGAISLPDSQFDAAKLPADKATPLVFYCGGLKCVLSGKSAEKARAAGYTNVATYPEGYPEWTQLYGAPAAAAAPAAEPAKPAALLAPGKEKGTATAASFIQVMKDSPASLVVVDVRDAKEFKAGAMKGSINIPIDQLEKKIDSLPAGKPLVFVCGTGGRAGEAYDMVKLMRGELQPWFIDAEITFNADGSFSIKEKK
ncbi:MAG: rhodanese-like domain-containing protein [Thiobacillus sp.]|nr:rhodanese-like domain-containing protein [Thiobacillus sp.]